MGIQAGEGKAAQPEAPVESFTEDTGSVSRKATLTGNVGVRNSACREVLRSKTDASVFFHYIESFAHIYCLGIVFLTAIVLPAICTDGRSLCGPLARHVGLCSWTSPDCCTWAPLCTSRHPQRSHARLAGKRMLEHIGLDLPRSWSCFHPA